MSADKRSVATDALATLGTIIDANQKRDAIHLAVEPVIAQAYLEPGDHITVVGGIASRCAVGKGLGIVDPFLSAAVEPGQRFWFIMYPRMVTSLRHVWAHPAFKDEDGTPAPLPLVTTSKGDAERWLHDFCAANDCPNYELVMGRIIQAGGSSLSDWDDEYFHFDGTDAHASIPDEFWDKVEIVLGKKIETKPKYFSCSC